MLKKVLAVGMVFLFILLVVSGCGQKQKAESGEKLKISVLIPGKHIDVGFMEAGFKGYTLISQKLSDKVEADFISDVSATSDEKVLTEAMRDLAKKNPDMIIGHGGQCSLPAETVAKEFPDIKFVVIQGNVKGENLASYVVKQEESAWLAGALAGLMTKSNIVGHISGAWPNPGLIGRAAFYDGLMYTNSKATFLTWFTGNLDDKTINAQAAAAEISKGADIIYTMLNSGRAGVIDEMRKNEGKAWHIGNVSDWTKVDKTFIGSAVADSSVAIYNTALDLVSGKWEGNKVKSIGLEEDDIVKLTMSADVPKNIQDKIMELRKKLMSGELKIKTTYEGKEFYPVTGEFVEQTFKEELKKK